MSITIMTNRTQQITMKNWSHFSFAFKELSRFLIFLLWLLIIVGSSGLGIIKKRG